MEAFIKQHFSGLFDAVGDVDVVGKDRCTGETKQLRIFKETYDSLVSVTELAAVAFVEDKDNPLFSQVLQLCLISFMGNGIVQFLNGGQFSLLLLALSCLISVLVLLVVSTLSLAKLLNSLAV